MSTCQRARRPLARCLRQAQGRPAPALRSARPFSTTSDRRDAEGAKMTADPTVVGLAAFRTKDVPFELMPFQCFQEARKLLRDDRQDKLAQIAAETARIARLEAADPAQFRGGDKYKQKRLRGLRGHVERLKVLADINDPIIKARFDAGKGDMSKPIYRYLARRRWQAYAKKVIMQRIEQFHIVPDVLPKFEPIMATQLFFGQYLIAPGAIVQSSYTTVPPTLRVQVFDRAKRLVSVVVMDSDVPQPDTDDFGRRCHFVAANVRLDALTGWLSLDKLAGPAHLAVPWLPPTSQKGAPYHRLSVFVLEQNDAQRLDVKELERLYKRRDGFSLRSFRDKFALTPIGFNMFRTIWDDATEGVMERFGIPGADVELKHKRIPSTREPRKAKGWEAKRQGPKYRHLWKYTHRIASPRRKFVR